MSDPRTVGVVGAGQMGAGIAQVAAVGGFEVTLSDVAPGQLERAMKGIRDPDAMDQAAREMDQGREEIRQRLGDIQVAVELIRQVRDEA